MNLSLDELEWQAFEKVQHKLMTHSNPSETPAEALTRITAMFGQLSDKRKREYVVFAKDLGLIGDGWETVMRDEGWVNPLPDVPQDTRHTRRLSVSQPEIPQRMENTNSLSLFDIDMHVVVATRIGRLIHSDLRRAQSYDEVGKIVSLQKSPSATVDVFQDELMAVTSCEMQQVPE